MSKPINQPVALEKPGEGDVGARQIFFQDVECGDVVVGQRILKFK